MGYEGACALSEVLKVNTTLITLDLTCEQQQQDREQSTPTKTFDETDNEIGTEGACALSEALKINTTLTALDLGCTQKATQKQCAEHDSNNSDRIGTRIQEEGVRALSEAFKLNTTLTTLDLFCAHHQQHNTRPSKNTTRSKHKAVNEIGVAEACALSEALKVNTTLTSLDLGGVQKQRKAKIRNRHQ